MVFKSKWRLSALIAWAVWSFFLVAVFATRQIFALPDALGGVQLLRLWIVGGFITIFALSIIWCCRKLPYKWLWSIFLNLTAFIVLLFLLKLLGLQPRHSHAIHEPVVEEKRVLENGQEKIMTITATKDMSGSQFYDWFMLYLIVLGIVYPTLAFVELNKQKTHQIALKEKLWQAKMDMLRAQLNPHFMFNALNTVSALMDEDTKEAQQVLEDFSFLLRSVIDKSKVPFTTVEEEITFIRRYTLIEQKRFAEKLKVCFAIAEDVGSAKVPTMILQPIVENAIKHGVLKKEDQGEVVISCFKENEKLLLQVKDDGAGLDTQKIVNRVGLSNTSERLASLYGKRATLDLQNLEEGGLQVTINIPFELLKYA